MSQAQQRPEPEPICGHVRYTRGRTWVCVSPPHPDRQGHYFRSSKRHLVLVKS